MKIFSLCERSVYYINFLPSVLCTLFISPRCGQGLQRADSLAFDFHKWLHVPYDAGPQLLEPMPLTKTLCLRLCADSQPRYSLANFRLRGSLSAGESSTLLFHLTVSFHCARERLVALLPGPRGFVILVLIYQEGSAL